MRINRVKLIAELAKRDMKQSELAVLSGVSRGTICCIANGKSCTPVIANKLANALGMTLEEIIED